MLSQANHTTMATIDPLLKRFHRLTKAPSPPFHRALTKQHGRQSRATWLNILKLLRRVQHTAAFIQHSPDEQQRLLTDVKASINEAVLYLLQPHQTFKDHHVSSQLRVWSSPQNARLATLQEAIALAYSRRDAPFAHSMKPPLIILISEPCDSNNNHALPRNFVDSWSSTCYGVAEIETIHAQSSDDVYDSLTQLFGTITQTDMFPVLMVVHASQDSNITTNLPTLKQICQSWNVRLCLEGPALAMLAQSHRPAAPEECAKAADVKILDPASWFGFPMCAIASYHKLIKTPVSNQFNHRSTRLSDDAILLKDHDDTHDLATAPVLNLWTVLSTIGMKHIRDSIDAVTVLADTLVNNLTDSPNIVTAYDGIACVVKISYALSREDRLLPKEKSQEHVSLVNDVIFASLQKDSEALCIQQRITSEGKCLNFAPARLLSSGTLWIPPVDMVDDYSRKLQDTVDKYESCRAASVAFRSCVAKCHEIQFLVDIIEQPELHLSFGAFRIVPVEMGHFWDQDENTIEIVEGLTQLVAKELTESPHDISTPKYVVQEETEKARALAEQFSRSSGGLLRTAFLSKAFNRRWSFPHGYGGGGPLPFDVFLHSDSQSKFHNFVSIEPREKCKPVHAVHQATVASDIMIACVTKIMELWRAGEIILPPEHDEVDPSISDHVEPHILDDQCAESIDRTQERLTQSQIFEQTSDDESSIYDAPVPSGSEVSSATHNSAEEYHNGSHQEYEQEVELSNDESYPSISSEDYAQELGTRYELQDNAMNAVQGIQTGDCRMKNHLSVSIIGKSSRGTRTDEDGISSDYVLSTAAKTEYSFSSEGASKASDQASGVEAIPMVEAANQRSWFGAWRTRGWGNYQNDESDEESADDSADDSEDESDDESASSMTGDGPSGDDNRDSQNEDGSEDEDDPERRESSSSSSDGSPDDRLSKDNDSETSEDTDRDDRENDDPISDSESDSSKSSDATEEHPNRVGRRTEESSSNQQSRTSRLLAWMRSGKAQQPGKSKQRISNPPPYKGDSEYSSSSSGSGLEDRETHSVHSSEQDEESIRGKRISTSSSHQQETDYASDETNDGSTTGSEMDEYDRDSDSSDGNLEASRNIRTHPSTSSYGFRWFGKAEKPSNPSSTRGAKSSRDSGSELNSWTETEPESQESGVRGKKRHGSPGNTQQKYESRSESEWSERTEISKESYRTSPTDDTSESSDSRRRYAKKDGTRQRRDTTRSSSDMTSRTSEDSSSSSDNNAAGGRSFLEWVLPSWATTPPKLGKRRTPIRGVNSRLQLSHSSQSSIDSDSDSEASYESKRRIVKGKNSDSSGGGIWFQARKASSNRTRHRRTHR